MLKLVDITKDYKVGDSSQRVLKGISLSFRDKEFVSILGPSGCGKTTMLNIIGGLDKYTTGDLLINGTSTKNYKDRDWDTYRNHTIGFVFQSYNLIPHLSILKNVELALSIGGISPKEKKQKAMEALKKVGLEKHVNKKPNQLSGGQCQRVSIARALVNNPSIILADEPTGALDSETSLQVLDLIKEISKEHLVIMVTHNPDLANKYSTRIVRMLDGKIEEDSNPLSETEVDELEKACIERKNSISLEERKKQEKKTSMSFLTALGLSGSNLLTKKRRTFLTAFASSIGIIGISVILSVSNGTSNYVDVLQSDSASSNYITLNSSYVDYNNIMNQSSSDTEQKKYEEYPEDVNGVYPYTPQSRMNIKSTKQILSSEYVSYLEENINGKTEDTALALGVSYSRNIALNLITDKDGVNGKVDASSWEEMIDNMTYLKSQYTVLASEDDKDPFPSDSHEVVLVVDTYNRLSTTILDQLGVSYDTDMGLIDYSKFLGKTFSLATNDSYYIGEDYGDKKIYREASSQDEIDSAYSSGIQVKIKSILRAEKDISNDWIGSGIGYTQALVKEKTTSDINSAIVNYQKANPEYDVLTGKTFAEEKTDDSIASMMGQQTSSKTYDTNMTKLGASTDPSSIVIYPKDYDSKAKIIDVIEKWNHTEIYQRYGNEKDAGGNYIADQYKVMYTDYSQLIVSSLNSLINIITYALVAFSAISLVVSSIMIAIIIYASVIERIKEIGTIRSLGGRKKDIKRIFLSEAIITALVSSAIALLGTLGLNTLINTVLGAVAGISTIATLSLPTAIIMILLNLGLNLLSALSPSSMAARKDPVVCLRTE